MVDLQTVQLAVREINQYANNFIGLMESLSQEQLWSRDGNIPNSIGTLARHLTGNLNHYFGAGILKNGYVRKRDKEFSEIGLTKEQVLSDLRAAIQVAKQANEKIDKEKINLPYTTSDGEQYESLAYHIIRLATHFALHCGQADYAANYLNGGKT